MPAERSSVLIFAPVVCVDRINVREGLHESLLSDSVEQGRSDFFIMELLMK